MNWQRWSHGMANNVIWQLSLWMFDVYVYDIALNKRIQRKWGQVAYEMRPLMSMIFITKKIINDEKFFASSMVSILIWRRSTEAFIAFHKCNYFHSKKEKLVHLRCSSAVCTSRHCVIDKRITVLLSLRFFGVNWIPIFSTVCLLCLNVIEIVDVELLSSSSLSSIMTFYVGVLNIFVNVEPIRANCRRIFFFFKLLSRLNTN